MLVVPIATQTADAETRDTVRNYMSLEISLVCEGEQSPAQICNLSGFGALVEALRVPQAGADVRLVRGPHEVAGSIAWADGKRLGIRFASPVSVRDWLRPVRQPAGSATGGQTPGSLAAGGDQPGPSDPAARMMHDLLLVSRLLDDLGQDLAADPDTTEKHLGKMQNLDVAVQMLTSVCWELASEHNASAPQLAAARDLRRSCEAALQSPPSEPRHQLPR